MAHSQAIVARMWWPEPRRKNDLGETEFHGGRVVPVAAVLSRLHLDSADHCKWRMLQSGVEALASTLS